MTGTNQYRTLVRLTGSQPHTRPQAASLVLRSSNRIKQNVCRCALDFVSNCRPDDGTKEAKMLLRIRAHLWQQGKHAQSTTLGHALQNGLGSKQPKAHPDFREGGVCVLDISGLDADRADPGVGLAKGQQCGAVKWHFASRAHVATGFGVIPGVFLRLEYIHNKPLVSLTPTRSLTPGCMTMSD